MYFQNLPLCFDRLSPFPCLFLEDFSSEIVCLRIPTLIPLYDCIVEVLFWNHLFKIRIFSFNYLDISLLSFKSCSSSFLLLLEFYLNQSSVYETCMVQPLVAIFQVPQPSLRANKRRSAFFGFLRFVAVTDLLPSAAP